MCCQGLAKKKNVDLWKRFDKAMRFHHMVTFTWVKGHKDDKYNNRCDKLAVTASQKNYNMAKVDPITPGKLESCVLN